MYSLIKNNTVLIKDNSMIGTFDKDELIDYLINELNENVQEIGSLNYKLYDCQHELNIVEGDFDDVSRNYSYLENTKEDLEQKILQLEDDLEYSQREIRDLKDEIYDLKDEISSNEDLIRELNEQLQECEDGDY